MGVTEGNGNEKEVFRKFIKSNKFYVLDRGYARYDLFEEIARKGRVRLRDNAVWKEIEAKELTDADKSEGIQKDIIVRLGTNDHLSAPVRVLEFYHKGSSARKRKPKG